jgi:hypothetical protein
MMALSFSFSCIGSKDKRYRRTGPVHTFFAGTLENQPRTRKGPGPGLLETGSHTCPTPYHTGLHRTDHKIFLNVSAYTRYFELLSKLIVRRYPEHTFKS